TRPWCGASPPWCGARSTSAARRRRDPRSPAAPSAASGVIRSPPSTATCSGVGATKKRPAGRFFVVDPSAAAYLPVSPLLAGVDEVCAGGTAAGGSSGLVVSRKENRPANQVKKPGLSCCAGAGAAGGLSCGLSAFGAAAGTSTAGGYSTLTLRVLVLAGAGWPVPWVPSAAPSAGGADETWPSLPMTMVCWFSGLLVSKTSNRLAKRDSRPRSAGAGAGAAGAAATALRAGAAGRALGSLSSTPGLGASVYCTVSEFIAIIVALSLASCSRPILA